MADYLADRFAGWMGWGSPGGTDLLGRGETSTTSGAYATRVGPLGVAEAKRRRRSEEADLYAASGPGWSSERQSGSFGPPNPDMIKRAQLASLEAPLQARDISQPPRLPIGPGPYPGERAMPGGGMAIPGGLPGGGPGVPPPMSRPVAPQGQAPPMNPQGAGPTVPQGGGGGQPPPLSPAGAGPDLLGRVASSAGNLLGGLGNWMRSPVGDSRVTRGQMLFNMIGDVGEGLSTTGNLGAGLRHARQGQQELLDRDYKQRESDEEREYRRLDLRIKERELARGEKPIGGPKEGYWQPDASGQWKQVIKPADSSADVAEATNPFQAKLRALKPEERTPERIQQLADEEQALKDRLDPWQRAQLEEQERDNRRAEENLALTRKAAERADERLALSTDTAAAARTAEAEGRAMPERVLNRQNKIIAAQRRPGGWDNVSEEDRDWYEDHYRDKAAPKSHFDAATGQTTTYQPNVTHMPLPPSMRPPPGAATATPTPTAVPQPGVTVEQTTLGKDDTKKIKDAVQLKDKATRTVTRINELLNSSGSTGRAVGENRTQIEQQLGSLTAIIGQLNEVGVMQKSDIEDAKDQIGNVTGWLAAGGAAVGYEPARAGLNELLNRIDIGLKSKLPRVKDEAEADKMPVGIPYLMPDDTIGQN